MSTSVNQRRNLGDDKQKKVEARHKGECLVVDVVSVVTSEEKHKTEFRERSAYSRQSPTSYSYEHHTTLSCKRSVR